MLGDQQENETNQSSTRIVGRSARKQEEAAAALEASAGSGELAQPPPPIHKKAIKESSVNGIPSFLPHLSLSRSLALSLSVARSISASLSGGHGSCRDLYVRN